MVEVEWNADELRAFARSLGKDKEGRALRGRLNAQFDSITKDLQDRLRQHMAEIPGAGTYPAEAAEGTKFKTKLIGGKNARVSIVGQAKTPKGKWRELGRFLDDGLLLHPVFGRWRTRELGYRAFVKVPAAPRAKTNAMDQSEPNIRDEIRQVLTEYLDKLADIRSTA